MIIIYMLECGINIGGYVCYQNATYFFFLTIYRTYYIYLPCNIFVLVQWYLKRLDQNATYFRWCCIQLYGYVSMLHAMVRSNKKIYMMRLWQKCDSVFYILFPIVYALTYTFIVYNILTCTVIVTYFKVLLPFKGFFFFFSF